MSDARPCSPRMRNQSPVGLEASMSGHAAQRTAKRTAHPIAQRQQAVW